MLKIVFYVSVLRLLVVKNVPSELELIVIDTGRLI